LLAATQKQLAMPRPVVLPELLGRQLLQHMVEKNGTADPARQHYLVQNVRKGFFDPNSNKDDKRKQKGKGKQGTGLPAVPVAWAEDTNHHLGYLPLNLAGLAWNDRFQDVLTNVAFRAYSRLRNKPLTFQAEHIHVLFWCNHGCHRSVGFCRLMQIAADTWGWQQLSCN
jgi:hypothetical protein